MLDLLSLTSPWQNKPQIPQRVQYQPLSPKEKARVDRFITFMTRKSH